MFGCGGRFGGKRRLFGLHMGRLMSQRTAARFGSRRTAEHGCPTAQQRFCVEVGDPKVNFIGYTRFCSRSHPTITTCDSVRALWLPLLSSAATCLHPVTHLKLLTGTSIHNVLS